MTTPRHGQIEELPLTLGPGLAAALPRLARALTGEAAIHPTPAGIEVAQGGPGPSRRPHPEDGPEDLAVVIGTSGSTGTPKLAMLTAPALAASIGATHRRLGGPGQWLLALPPHHIAGLQVLFRGLVAGTPTIALSQPFTTDEFVSATTLLDPDLRHYTALVPTQVARLLEAGGVPGSRRTRSSRTTGDGIEALRSFDAVLVGGAPLPPRLRARADAEGIVLVATYGMSETGGGCIYDGVPLDGTRFRFDEDGRILLSGPTLAVGYLDRPDLTDAAFSQDADGTRWFRTDDRGRRLHNGQLYVEGRLDDLINTGGLKVAPRVVEEAILGHFPEIADVAVVGLPDENWGERVAALLVPSTESLRSAPELTVTSLRDRLRGILPDHALPKTVATTTAIPTKGPGKPDRAAVRSLMADP